MVSKAITHMALKRKKIRKEKKEREEDWTQVARARSEYAINWVIEDNMTVCALIRLIKSQWRNCKIQLCITKKVLSATYNILARESRRVHCHTAKLESNQRVSIDEVPL
jgi:hypothetical protein